jgi:hydrogenase small subunit
MSTVNQNANPERGTATPPDLLSLAEDREPGRIVERETDLLARALSCATGDGGVEVTWLQGQSCTGCTISLLQGEYPELSEELRRFKESISFHPTLMTAAAGDAMEELQASPDVLIVEGSVPTRIPEAATLGVDERGNGRPILDWVIELGERADVVLAVGTCAAYGGIPAAGTHDPTTVGDNPTGARGLQFDGTSRGGVFGPEFRTGAELPVINVPGCPAHPDHVLLTLATVVNGHRPDLDEYNRPLPLFGPLVHDDCALREEYEAANFASDPGEDGCLYDAGCAGVYAHCDDSLRMRNGGTTICRQVGAPCIGCVEPGFWDRFTPFYDTGEDDLRDPAEVKSQESEKRQTHEGTHTGTATRRRSEATGPLPDWLRTFDPKGLIIALPIALFALPMVPALGLYWIVSTLLPCDLTESAESFELRNDG